MMLCEFEKLIDGGISPEDYKIVELVYNYHPSISDKACIAKLYEEFGMRVIKDMVPTAERVRDLEMEKHKVILEIQLLNDKLKDIDDEYYNAIN